MGTRNLTMVISEGKTKIAQYGQWDGYPSGQGATALTFLRKIDHAAFKKRLKSVSFFTKEEIDKIADEDKTTNGRASERIYAEKPWLSRDLGADILNAVGFGIYGKDSDNKKGIKCVVDKLIDSSNFAADSLFCEWAYVIDLDKKTFEIYNGFNQTPLNKNERFFGLEQEGKHKTDYEPVGLLKSYSLRKLPTVNKFLKDLKPKEEDED